MSSPWLVVARREYAEGVRSRWFVVTCLLVPVFFAGIIGFTVWAQVRGGGKVARLVLVDETREAIGKEVCADIEAGKLGERQRFHVELGPPDADPGALAARIDAGELDGYLVLPADVATGGLVVYRGTNASSSVDMAILEHSLRTAIVHSRARALGLRPEQTTALLAPVPFDTRQAVAPGGRGGAGKEVTGGAAFGVAYAVSLLLYMAILLYGVTVMRSVVLEKSSRVMEVVVSCARPWDLMLGKVVGNGALGLTQLGVWGAMAVVATSFRGALLGPDVGSMPMPSIGPGQLACIVTFFLGGYFLYSSIFAAVGAANDSERDAQQAQMPVMLVLVVASLCFPIISGAPRDPLAVVLTTIPLLSPVLMPMRVMLTAVPVWQIALSLVTLLGTTALTLWGAARIFRVGILMYGKRLTLRELVRWVREG